MSVQPKGTPAHRKAFLQPSCRKLMQDLNEGIALIGWPEAAPAPSSASCCRRTPRR
jgi:hypothetical protein